MNTLSTTLLSWYDREARTLPWRKSQDPYRVWISEIMLQQTRAETVIPRYTAFLEAFPDVYALAEADEQAVLKAWEGMGYYSRARNLLKAAIIVAQSGGTFPETATALRALPGIGAYTAGAIASIAYGIPEPALDGNQARVLSRILAYSEPIRTPAQLYNEALSLMDYERPGDYNQALMDLGSGICLPRKPNCAHCPISGFCAAYAAGDPESFPQLPAPAAKREIALTVVLAVVNGRILVRQRPANGLLARLWEFPNSEGAYSPDLLPGARMVSTLADAKHVFTHLIWNMRGVLVELDAVPEGMSAVDRAELDALPFPTAFAVYREIAQELLQRNADQAQP